MRKLNALDQQRFEVIAEITKLSPSPSNPQLQRKADLIAARWREWGGRQDFLRAPLDELVRYRDYLAERGGFVTDEHGYVWARHRRTGTVHAYTPPSSTVEECHPHACCGTIDARQFASLDVVSLNEVRPIDVCVRCRTIAT